MKISDFNFNTIDKQFQENYKINIQEDSTVAKVIVDHIFDTSSIIHLKQEGELETQIKKYFEDKITKQISKGAPIEILLTTFSPKFKINEQTNFNIYPDMADLFTFIHLQKIAKSIKEIYPYNFRFIIVFKGDLYKNIGFWSEQELNKTFNILKQMNEQAEIITGQKRSIVLYRWNEFLKNDSDKFKSKLYEKAIKYYDFWEIKKEPYYSQIEKWKKDFSKYLLIEHSDPFFQEFFTKEASKIRAFNNLAFREGEMVDIILKDYPNLIMAHTRKKTKFFSLNLNPLFRNLTHFYLTTIEDNVWDFKMWKEIEDYEPVYFDEYDYPLYFRKKENPLS
jgi:pyoverdine/dityrosine biosynthesis protein Dit1